MADGVLVVIPRVGGGGLGKTGEEAFAFARALASDLDAGFDCAVVGADAEAAATEAAERGADRVLVVQGDRFANGGDELVAASVEAARIVDPALVVIPRGSEVLELTPRLAARLGGGSVTSVTGVRRGDGDTIEAVAAVFGGAALAVYRFAAEGPAVVGLAPALVDPPAREAGRMAERVDLEVPETASRVRVVEAAVDSGVDRLEDARIVVSGGRGLQSGEHFGLIRDLASALGGLPGASRAIVDDAWAPPEQQVGLTGAIVTPDVYIAAGISGASQHMAGCSNARIIVAINSDPSAPIFRYAHLGIVDDCLDVLPALIEARGRA